MDTNDKSYLQSGRDYFRINYSLASCYNNPRANLPMLLHLHEQGERTNELLAEIVQLLKGQDD